MISTKKHIRQLASILAAKEITDVIISPGSRSGPLTHTFAGAGSFNCLSVVDERSAAYFGIGLARAKQKPVVLVCSSGTAGLNYAPAVAEAFYLNVPLVVLTADRPDYWIDQAENQCINQKNIYQDFIKKEVSLPLGETEEELWFAGRLINECINMAVEGIPGPVHINIPLEEPLHDLVEEELPEVKLIDQPGVEKKIASEELVKLATAFNQAKKVLILAGQQGKNPKLESLLADFSEKTGAVVLAEHLSNLNHPSFCKAVDLLVPAFLNDEPDKFRPDLLISFGGQFVSKSLKQFLRKNKPDNHWHLRLSSEHFDTYQSLTKVVHVEASVFFEQLLENVFPGENQFQETWKKKETELNRLRDEFTQQTVFCDLKVFGQVLKAIPGNSVLHLGNSSPVRYALLCDAACDVEYHGNRGTAGIDGPMSTAVGFASASEKLNTIILGDLSFFYDSNALWNKYIGSNLRVIVINNRGGNIFGMIKGPSGFPAFQEYFFTANKFKAEGVARTFELDYFKAENEDELNSSLSEFYSPAQNKAAVLEVFTDAETNSQVFRELFKKIKKEIQ